MQPSILVLLASLSGEGLAGYSSVDAYVVKPVEFSEFMKLSNTSASWAAINEEISADPFIFHGLHHDRHIFQIDRLPVWTSDSDMYYCPAAMDAPNTWPPS